MIARYQSTECRPLHERRPVIGSTQQRRMVAVRPPSRIDLDPAADPLAEAIAAIDDWLHCARKQFW